MVSVVALESWSGRPDFPLVYRLQSDRQAPVGCLDPLHSMEWEFVKLTGHHMVWDENLGTAAMGPAAYPDEVGSPATLEGYSLYSQLICQFGWDDSISVKMDFASDLSFKMIFAAQETGLAWAASVDQPLLHEMWKLQASAVLGPERFSSSEAGYSMSRVSVDELRRVGIHTGYSPLEPVVTFYSSGVEAGILTGNITTDHEVAYLMLRHELDV